MPSYINVYPFVRSLLTEKFVHLVRATPTTINEAFSNNKLDAALISSVEAFGRESMWLPYCIAAHKAVLSVHLYTKYPVEALGGHTIGVTSESATSVELLKVVARDYWHVEINICKMAPKVPYDAFLLIGDEALKNPHYTGYETIDLASVWYEMTALPFVFAVMCVKEMEYKKSLEKALEKALTSSESAKMKIVDELQGLGIEKERLQLYFKCLSYRIGEAEKRSLELFADRSILNNKMNHHRVHRERKRNYSTPKV